MHTAFIQVSLIFLRKLSFFLIDNDKQKRKTEKRLKKLKQILENNKENLMFSVDSDEDFSTNFMNVGDKIDYL